MKYKVGDKVRIVGEWPKDGSACQNPAGKMDKWLGKVMTIVGFDYNLGERCYKMAEDKKDHPDKTEGWFWNEACISGLATQKIVITTDGKTTTAKLFNGKELVKSAEAKCSPSDEFDFEKGAALAVDRLLGREEKKLFPFEAIKAGYLLCVRDDEGSVYNMTVGPGMSGALACCCPEKHWWPLSCFGSELRYADSAIIKVYGYARNSGILANSTEGRELLWSRS